MFYRLDQYFESLDLAFLYSCFLFSHIRLFCGYILLLIKLSKLHHAFGNQSIGAVNTIIRRPSDGKLIGYNTDCEACATAIEDALRGTDLFFIRILKKF